MFCGRVTGTEGRKKHMPKRREKAAPNLRKKDRRRGYGGPTFAARVSYKKN